MSRLPKTSSESEILTAWEQSLYSHREISKLYRIPTQKVRDVLAEIATIDVEEQKQRRAKKQAQLWQEVEARFRRVAAGIVEAGYKRTDSIAVIRQEFPDLSPETVELFFDRSIGSDNPKLDISPSARDREIVNAWESEITTLDALGKKFGLTRERVRQILKKNGAKSKAEVAADVRVKLEARLAEKRDLLIDELKSISLEQPLSKVEAAAILAQKFPEFPDEMVRKLVSSSGIPLTNMRATVPNFFSSLQLELAVLMCFGLSYPRALEVNDYTQFVDPRHEAELRRFSASDSFPRNVEFTKILNAIGFASIKREQKVLDSFAHGDYERRRIEIWSENGWENGAGGRYWPPTQQTISKRVGGGYWNDAMEKLGFPTSSKKGRPRVGYLHNEESLLKSLENFLVECAKDNPTNNPSVQAYELWRSQEKYRGAKHASVTTIRSYFGSWNKAIYSVRRQTAE